MMPFGDWSWRVMITRSAFEDAWQGPRMVFAVGRSVDARAGCAVPVRSSGSHSEQARRHGDSPQVCSAVQFFSGNDHQSRFSERKVVITPTDFFSPPIGVFALHFPGTAVITDIGEFSFWI